MSIFNTIVNFAANLISQAGYAGIFVLMVLESATLPVPSEVVLPLAGYLVSQGRADFWLVVIVASVGSLVGTAIDYAIGYWLGREVILHYGKKVGLNEKHLETSEKWFKKYGPITVLLARFVPFIRTLIAFPAGIAEMSLPKFFLYSAVGIFVWDALLVYAGDVAGANVAALGSKLSNIFDIVGVLAVAIGAAYLIYWWRKTRSPPESGSTIQTPKKE